MKIVIFSFLVISFSMLSLQGILMLNLANLRKAHPEHVTDILTQNFPPVTEHTIWRNELNLNYKRTAWVFKNLTQDGVEGPQWTPTLAQPVNDFTHIASPVPKQEKRRIIAQELPARTLSPSSYDMPKRKDVVQVTLPQSTLKTVEYVIDPNRQFGKVATGDLFHGINSLPQKTTTFGYNKIFRFKGQVDPTKVGQIYQDSINASDSAEKNADQLLKKISV